MLAAFFFSMLLLIFNIKINININIKFNTYINSEHIRERLIKKANTLIIMMIYAISISISISILNSIHISIVQTFENLAESTTYCKNYQ